MSSSGPLSSGSKKRAAVSTSEADEEASSSNQHKLRRLADARIDTDAGNGDDQSKPSADPHHDLDLAHQRRSQALADIEAAQQRLNDSLSDIEKARQDIRSRGEAEFDSLLVVGNDSISHLLRFFGAKELCRLEMVCASFKRQSSEAWKALDKAMGQHNRSMSDCPKTRCVRYVRGSEYAQKMEMLASRHRWGDYRRYHEDPGDFETVPQLSTLDSCGLFISKAFGCSFGFDATCDFPNMLSQPTGGNTYELFLRLSEAGVVLLEGIFPLRYTGQFPIVYPCLDMALARCQDWPDFERLLTLYRSDGESLKEAILDEHSRPVEEALKKTVTMTLTTFSEAQEPHLVASIDEFVSDDELEHDDGDPWLGKVLGQIPMKPHDVAEHRIIESLDIQYGWSKTKDILGFRFSRGEHDLYEL